MHFFIAIALGYAFTGQFIFILGLIHLLYTWLLWILILIGTLLNLGIIVLFLKDVEWRKALEHIQESPFLERAFFFMSIIVLLLHMFFSLAPQIHWDAMSHHYLVPKYFLQHHALVDFPDIIFSYYPSLVEMQFLAGMALGGEQTANLIGNSHGVIFYLGFFALALLLLKNWRIGTWAGLVFLCVQGIHMHFEGGWNDLGVSIFILASVMLIFEYGKTSHRGVFYLSAIFAGSALASKHYAWIPLFFILTFLLYDNLFNKKGLMRAKTDQLVFILVALSMPVLWYLRSYVLTGNPVYPFSVFGLFPTYDLPPFVLTSWVNTGFKRNILSFLAYPYHLMFSREWVSGLTGRFPYLLLLAPMSLIEMRKKEIRALWIFTLWTLFIMYFAAPFETRYMLYILPFLAVLVGHGILIAISKIGVGHRFTLPLIFFIFLIPFSMNQKIFEHYWNDKLRVILKVEWKDQYLLRQSHNYGMIHWMNNHLPEDAHVLCLENRLYRMNRDFITWYGMRVKYPENAVEAMDKNYTRGNTHMYLGESGMAQAYILWHIFNLPENDDGFVEFKIEDVLLNLMDEPIPEKFWILRQLGMIRDMERWGFDKTMKNGETWYRVKREVLDDAVANHAAIILVDLFKDMVQKKWIVLAGDGAEDGLNMVFKFNYDKYFEDTANNR